MTRNEATNSTRRTLNKPRDITNMVSNDVYGLILDYIDMYNIPIPKTFALHPCGLYARKRLKHWSNNSNMSMHLDASNLKEVIYEWINGPYVDKDYVCKYDIECILECPHPDYEEGEASIIARKNGFRYDYDEKRKLRTYLLETLTLTKVNFNGVKGILLYDATNLESIILDWFEKNGELRK
jgi:hypothetical protein